MQTVEIKPFNIIGISIRTTNEDGQASKEIAELWGKFMSETKTTAKGDLMQGLIVNHWSKIFEMQLDRVYDTDFEVFGEKAQNTSDAEVDFYVGIK